MIVSKFVKGSPRSDVILVYRYKPSATWESVAEATLRFLMPPYYERTPRMPIPQHAPCARLSKLGVHLYSAPRVEFFAGVTCAETSTDSSTDMTV